MNKKKSSRLLPSLFRWISNLGSRRHTARRLREVVATQMALANAEFDLPSFLKMLTVRAHALRPTAQIYIGIIEGDVVVYRIAATDTSAAREIRIAHSPNLSGICIREGRVVILEDSETDPRVDRETSRQQGVRSAIIAPLGRVGEPVGILVISEPEPYAFDDQDIQSVTLVAGIIGSYLAQQLIFEANRKLLAERTEALERLSESEEKFRGAMEYSVIGMALVSPAGEWLKVNRSLCNILGYEEAQLLGMTFQEITHPDDLAADLGFVEALLAGSIANCQLEKRYIRRDGSPIWILLAVSLVRGPDGEPLYFVAQIKDIDGRKHAEAALSQSKERLEASNRLLLMAEELGHVGHWQYDIATASLHWSDEVYRIYGVPIGAPLTPDESMRVYHPDDVERIVAARTSAMETGQGYTFEARLIRPDGSMRSIMCHANVERRADGTTSGLFGVIQDVSDRNAAELERLRLSERMELANRAAKIGVWEFNIPEARMIWGEGMFELYGVDERGETPSPAFMETLVAPRDLPRMLATLAAAITDGTPFEEEYEIIHRGDGEPRYVRASATVLRDRFGAPERIVGTNLDVTELRGLAERLSAEKERLRVTLQSIGDAVITTDNEMRIVFMNPVAETTLGWNLAEVVGRPLGDIFRIVFEGTEEPVVSPVARCLEQREVIKLEDGVVLIDRHGQRFDIQDTAAPVRTTAGEIVGAVLVFQDVSESRSLQRALSFSASHDVLTSLPNRAKFEAECRLALEASRRSGKTHALCFVDLDRFKIINDSAGHAAGDVMLQQVAGVLEGEIRSSDLVARLGGDEFGLLLRDCDLAKAEEICSKLIALVGAIRLPWGGNTYDVGASIGIVAFTSDSPSVGDLMSKADVACYAAKHAGRNRVSIYAPGQNEVGQQHREILQAAGLRSAIERNQLTLFAQEVRPTKTRERGQHHYELLVRMIDDTGALVLPAAFIPAAERYGLMTSIDRWVVSEALIRLGPELAARPALRIAINLSATSLSDPAVPGELLDIIARSSVPPQALQFEITETALMSHLSVAKRLISDLREAGCTIALDDFGSGLSSFNYLRHFPIDIIKIDGTFVRDIGSNAVDYVIVEAINEISHRLGAKTVAEFVETAEIAQHIEAIGVDYAQGFAIGYPMPFNEMLAEIDVAPVELFLAQAKA